MLCVCTMQRLALTVNKLRLSATWAACGGLNKQRPSWLHVRVSLADLQRVLSLQNNNNTSYEASKKVY